MDSRTIIAISLMLLIYIFFFQPSSQPPAATNTIQSSQAIDTSKSATAAAPARSDLENKSFELKNDVMTLRVNGLGSVLDASFDKYKDNLKNDTRVHFHYEDFGFNRSSLQIGDKIAEWRLVEASSSKIVLLGTTGGANISRTIELLPGNYFLSFKDQIENPRNQVLKAQSKILLFHPAAKETRPPGFFESLFKPQAEVQQSVVYANGSMHSKLLRDVSTPIQENNLAAWSGFTHKYFFMGAVPLDVSVSKIETKREADTGVVQEIQMAEKQISPNEKTTYTYSVYLGPKDLPELKKVNPELTKVVEYGDWLGPIARFLLGLLHFFYSLIPNYGVGIILLTLLVKMALFPLAFKSAVSMRRLQLISPKMKEIRDKYKDDKYRMNAEMMALYKTEKVNPVGGCLPLLLQMPVFFALYRVFFVSIELRHAPFFGWIHDLASHDPYLVTPILMTALMWLQQKLTPMPPAEDNEAMRMQRAMLKWMPIIFGGIMLFLPAGLNLYMLTNALISVIQQVWLNKHLNLKFPLSNASQSQATA